MKYAGPSFSRFLIVWTGQLLSRLGSGMSAFALGVHLYQASGRAAACSMLLLAAFLPSVVLAPLGGAIADRRDRRRLMALGDAGSALGILVVVAALSHGGGWLVYAAVGFSSLFAAIHGPAFKASVSDLVSRSDYARAGGLVQLAKASRYLLAPVAAAFLMARFSLRVVLAIDAGTFLLAALAVLIAAPAGPPREPARSGLVGDMARGARCLGRNGAVRSLLGTATMVTFCSGALQALFGPLMLSMADAAVFGRVQSIAATGMLASSILIASRGRTERLGGTLPAALAAMGVFFVVIGAGNTPATVAAGAFCLFAALPLVNTSLEVMFRRRMENAFQGRLWSLISLLSRLGMLAGFSVAGVLADRIGVLKDMGTGRAAALLVIFSGLALLAYAPLVHRRGRLGAII